MSLKTVSDLKRSISKAYPGIILNDINDIEGTIQKALNTVLDNIDIPEASDAETVTLYRDVYEYEIDDSIFNTEIRDLRPQGSSRTPSDRPLKKPHSVFDREKKLPQGAPDVSFKFVDGTPILCISSKRSLKGVSLDPMNDTDGWTVAGTAAALTQDTVDFYDGSGSLRFNLAGSGAGTLTKTLNSLDISDMEDVGVVFMAVKIPNADTLTSIELRLGSSASAYNNVTATDGFIFEFESEMWMLVAFDFSTASQTGTPDWSAIDYAQIIVNHTAVQTNFRIGALFMSFPTPYEIEYASSALFMNAQGVRSETIVNDSDEILLRKSAYALLEDEAALQLAREGGGTLASGIIQQLQAKLNGSSNDIGAYKRYSKSNLSERLKATTDYGNRKRLQRLFRK